MDPVDAVLHEQQTYYRYRATDYDGWIAGYMADVREDLIILMEHTHLAGDVLELASGTGYWTVPLSAIARTVMAIDGAPEMLQVLNDRHLPNVTTIEADLFEWVPPRRWDAVFFANWLAHVPPTRFEAFWEMVDAALNPGGVVVFIDVTGEERRIERRAWEQDGIPFVERRVEGRAYHVVKEYREPGALLGQLHQFGWTGTATPVGKDHGRGFVYYEVRRTASKPTDP